MTLTELRYIVTLAQCNHFGQAADRCNVTQPTLSIAVKKLEGELGVNIFERSKNNVQLTPIGQQIVDQSRRVLEEASAIKDIAKSGMNQLNTPLHVGRSSLLDLICSPILSRHCKNPHPICLWILRRAIPAPCASV